MGSDKLQELKLAIWQSFHKLPNKSTNLKLFCCTWVSLFSVVVLIMDFTCISNPTTHSLPLFQSSLPSHDSLPFEKLKLNHLVLVVHDPQVYLVHVCIKHTWRVISPFTLPCSSCSLIRLLSSSYAFESYKQKRINTMHIY